jgi:hypothetical protein
VPSAANGEVMRWIGDCVRSGALGMGGVAVIIDDAVLPGKGGSGIEGGGVGIADAPCDLRTDVCEPDRARAIAAASGESDSRLKVLPDALEVIDCLFNAASCC